MVAAVPIPRADWVRRCESPYDGHAVPVGGGRPSMVARTPRPVVVELRCPGCRARSSIAEPVHRVAPDGLVYPAIICLRPSCGFDGVVQLVDWDAEITSRDAFPGLRFGVGGGGR